MSAAAAPTADEIPFRVGTLNDRGLPLLIQPGEICDLGSLCDWMRRQPDWVQTQLTRHGALLFRGFDVSDAPSFERLARSVDSDLKNTYLGTSPRDALTDYVFTASELPGYYPIPQHCEMSFIAHPPRRLFFCCFVEPARGSGETPLVDFRAVYRDLDRSVLERFERGGIRIVRNYSGPEGGSRFDPWKLKRWDEMFLSTDRAVVERMCRAEGFEPHWLPNGGLRLISTQPVVRQHPLTGETVWHNHTQVFHLSAAPGEYRRIHALRPSLRTWGLALFARLLVAAQRLTRSSDEMAMHCTYADGSEIPDADMEHVRDVIWKNLVITPWQRGDVVAIDNFAVAHGRLPYRSPRLVAVCWA